MLLPLTELLVQASVVPLLLLQAQPLPAAQPLPPRMPGATNRGDPSLGDLTAPMPAHVQALALVAILLDTDRGLSPRLIGEVAEWPVARRRLLVQSRTSPLSLQVHPQPPETQHNRQPAQMQALPLVVSPNLGSHLRIQRLQHLSQSHRLRQRLGGLSGHSLRRQPDAPHQQRLQQLRPLGPI